MNAAVGRFRLFQLFAHLVLCSVALRSSGSHCISLFVCLSICLWDVLLVSLKCWYVFLSLIFFTGFGNCLFCCVVYVLRF